MEPCPTCGESEPFTGPCGTSDKDTRALCKRPAPPPAPSVTETLAAHGVKLRTEFEKKPRGPHFEEEPDGTIHEVEPATGERAELIAGLREHATFMCIEGAEKQRTLKAADMLEADVSLINEGNKAQQVAVPMTEAQIFACDPVPHVMFDQQRIDFARAIEAFHGITGAKP